jgi:sec-independent protein translocase protein TatA
MRPGGPEILIIVLVILLVFGISKIPQIGEALGKGIGAFKRGATEADEPKKKKAAKKGAKVSATKAVESSEVKVAEASETGTSEVSSETSPTSKETATPETVTEKT